VVAAPVALGDELDGDFDELQPAIPIATTAVTIATNDFRMWGLSQDLERTHEAAPAAADR
jgi:hypothetical protein